MTPAEPTDEQVEARMFLAEELRDALANSALNYGDCNRAAWALVDWLTAHDAEVVAQVEQERDEAQEHIARWLDDHPPLSVSERIQRGSTGDLAVDMMRYATRLKNRAEAAEARTAAVLAAVEALLPAECWVSRTETVRCIDFVGGEFDNGAVWVEDMCCLPCRVRATLAAVREAAAQNGSAS